MKLKSLIIATGISSIIYTNIVTAEDNLLAGTGVTLSGTLQVEAQYNEDYTGVDSSDFIVDEFSLSLEAQVHPLAKANVGFIYEEDGTPLEIDGAILTLGNENTSPIYLSVGQLYVPFGHYDSHMISDPLTLELGETREKAALLGFIQNGWYGSIYAFNGNTQEGTESKINHYGANFGFTQELEQINYDFGIDYINDIGDSNGITGVLESIAPAGDITALTDYEYVDGLSVHFSLNLANISFIGEYVTALDEFEHISSAKAEPQAWNIEAGYNFNILAKETTVAIAYQGTKEALALGLPETRILASISVGIYDNTSISMEYAQDEDYAVIDGGTGEDATSVIVQLALKF
ncbi:MAG: LbtU family siderophore porin [Thiomargarita sp.]|nr:LbtU family siderophore porin [Thiomargarita sp.]